MACGETGEEERVEDRGNQLLAAFDRLLVALKEAVRAHYGARLVSVAVFGSVARRTPGPNSDVDVLVIADPLPRGRIPRVVEFEPVEASLATGLDELRERGLDTRLSPVFRTPAEVEQYGGPIFLDMTEHVIILHDPVGFLREFLSGLRRQLAARGARRIPYKGAWYWDLGPPREGSDDRQ